MANQDILLLPNKDGVQDIVILNGKSQADSTLLTSIKTSLTENGRIPEYKITDQPIFDRGGSVADIINNNYVYGRGSPIWYICSNKIVNDNILGELETGVKKSLQPYISNFLISDLSVKLYPLETTIKIDIAFKIGKDYHNLTLLHNYQNHYADSIRDY